MSNNKVNKRYERLSASAKKQLIAESDKVLDELQDDSQVKIHTMDYFYKVAANYSQSKINSDANKKYVATSCIQVPIELIYAAGAIPVRVCSGSHSMNQVGAEFLPAKSCSLINATFGALYTKSLPVSQDPLAIINPTTCDQKKKMPEISDDIDFPFYTLEVPPTKDSEEAVVYWNRTIKKFTKDLEKITKNRITRKKLKEAINKVASAQLEYRRFHQLRKDKILIKGSDALLIANTFFYDDIETWTNNLKKLNNELEANADNNKLAALKGSPRILITGSPSIFPNFKLPIMIEKMGGTIVVDEFCSSNRLLYDTVAVDEWNMYDMVPAIADRYLKACTCPSFTPNTDRERKILNYIKEFKVDGVVYQSFSGCQLYELESMKINKLLEKQDTPMLFVETDYSPDDKGQLSTRIEAFIEALKTKQSFS